MSNDTEMNVERLEGIAKWLENGAVHVDESGEVYNFTMLTWNSSVDVLDEDEKSGQPWIGDCGSLMCIGGAAEQFYREGSKAPAATLLGLDHATADPLFYPWEHLRVERNETPDDDFFTPQRAAAVIRNLIKTGEVDWMVEIDEDA